MMYQYDVDITDQFEVRKTPEVTNEEGLEVTQYKTLLVSLTNILVNFSCLCQRGIVYAYQHHFLLDA